MGPEFGRCGIKVTATAVGRLRMSPVVADMGDAQVVIVACVAGIIHLVELGAAVIRRSGPLIAFAGLIRCRRGDDRDVALLQWLLQRRERRP